MRTYTLQERPHCSLNQDQIQYLARRWVEGANQTQIARELGTHTGNVRGGLMLRFHMKPRSPWYWQSTGTAAHLRRRMELTRIPRTAPGIPDPADYLPLNKRLDLDEEAYFCEDFCNPACPDCEAAAREANQQDVDAYG